MVSKTATVQTYSSPFFREGKSVAQMDVCACSQQGEREETWEQEREEDSWLAVPFRLN